LVNQSTLGPIERAAQQLSALLRPDWGTAFTVLDNNVLDVAGLVVVLVTLGACLGAWLYRMDADARSVTVLRSVALALPISAAVLVVIYWAAYQGSHAISPRFGIPFLAAASVGLGASIERRAGILAGLLGLVVWGCAWVGLVLAW
jgi:branched-subunit amino acid transport protein AzlD